MEALKASIITIGDELLMGQVTDTNSPWLAQQLESVNIQTIWRDAVPDKAASISQALDEAILRADLIITTGGLGPTSDDLTKKVLAEYFNRKLVRNEVVYCHVLELLSLRQRKITPEIEQQAFVPEGCHILKNRIGTAPGMWLEKGKKIIISLPGVPYEMKAIVSEELIPQLKKSRTTFSRKHRYFLLAGAAETDIAKRIEKIEKALPSYIKLAYLPGMGILRLRISGSSEEESKLEKVLNELTRQLENTLGSEIAAEEDIPMEAVVGRLLKEKHLKLGLAESCTGGLLAHKITNIPGSSEYFNGSIVSYVNEVKEHSLEVSKKVLQEQGAVSEKVVLQMAKAARKHLNVDIALSVSGILGPEGGSVEKPVGTVWMAISDKHKTEAKLFHFRFDRLQNKERTANAAFECLRRWLLGI